MFRHQVTRFNRAPWPAPEPFAKGGADLRVVICYRYPGVESKAAIELFPVAGKRSIQAARAAGLSASSIPALLVLGDNKHGLGHAVAQAITGAGINQSSLFCCTSACQKVLGDHMLR